VPAQHGPRGDPPVRLQAWGQEPGQRGEDRAVGAARAWPGLVRPSTAASCRSTSRSMSLDAVDRPGRTSRSASRAKIR
jgi:hypothetical protein